MVKQGTFTMFPGISLRFWSKDEASSTPDTKDIFIKLASRAGPGPSPHIFHYSFSITHTARMEV